MEKILFCFFILWGTAVFAVDMPSLRRQMANVGDLADIFNDVPEGTVVEDEIRERGEKLKGDDVKQVWQRRKEAFTIFLQEVLKNPVEENMRELACQIEALKNEVEKGLEICHKGELYDFAKFEDSALRDYLREMFRIYCYLYRGMVTLANEMGISPESFIKRGLDNEDLRNTGDDVIWSVEGLEEAPPPPLRRGTRPAFAPLFAEESQLKASKKEKIEKANIANDLSYALDLYDLAGISDEHAFLACIEDDGIKADANGFSKILEGRNMEISFPLRVDMLGRFDNREHWYPWSRRSDRIIGRPRSPFLNSCEVETPVGGCWQFYVTGTPSSAKKIIRHVLPYLHRYNIGYKIISNIGSMRRLYFSSRVENESQYGEFIIICPPTCRESQIIAEDLNSILTNGGFKMGGINIPSHDEEDRQRFTEKDFVTLCGNYSVGTSGGLFARYVSDYDKENSPEDEKKAPVILESLLENASEYAPCNLTYCGLSFGEGDDFIENVKILGLENQG